MSKTDALPKYICSQCWQKIDEFHKFHCSVQHAQDNYLNVKIKCETIDDPLNRHDTIANHHELDAELEKLEQLDDEPELEVKHINVSQFDSDNEHTKCEDFLSNIKHDEDDDNVIDTDSGGKKFGVTEIKYNSNIIYVVF